MSAPTIEQRIAATRHPVGRRRVMNQEWRELLFLHWEIDPGEIQKTLPEGLTVDTFEGKAYLGVVPFYMCKVRPSFMTQMPWLSNFLEMNVRTYVHDEAGTPGVWFYSLDANQPIAVRVAQRFFHLPYFDARMTARIDDASNAVSYQCQRTRFPRAEAPSTFTYQGKGNPKAAEPGTLNYFLAERYYLFSHEKRRDRIYSGRVHHAPYPLEEAQVASFLCDESIQQAGFDPPAEPPCSALYASGVTVKLYPLERQPPL